MVKEQTGESGLGLSPVPSFVKVLVFFPLEKGHCCLPLLGQVGIWFLPYFFFFNLWHRKETHRKNSRKINFSLFSPCLCITQLTISEQLPGNSAAEMSIIYQHYLSFFFLSCISSDYFDYYEKPSGQYSTGMPDVSPTLVYSEFFSSFLNAVAGSCRRRLRRMLWAWIRTHT